jgi:hypothetical protein
MGKKQTPASARTEVTEAASVEAGFEEARRPSPRGLRAKLPELAVEGLSVMFAVLLAFAVDQWREDRGNAQLAARARESILAEITANRGELLDSRSQHEDLMQHLTENLEQIEAGESSEIRVDFSFSLLSSAAWQTAQVTQAAHHLDYEWIIRVSRLYDLQEQFRESQSAILDQIGNFGAAAAQAGDVGPVLAALAGRVEILLDLQDGLIEAYETILGEAGENDG